MTAGSTRWRVELAWPELHVYGDGSARIVGHRFVTWATALTICSAADAYALTLATLERGQLLALGARLVCPDEIVRAKHWQNPAH